MASILVIEDNEELAYGLRHNLEFEGYDVDVAADGAAGLDRARRTEHDLVILDLMLPELDGFRVLKSMRESECTTPVLILTARGEEIDKVRGFKLGADDYVTKPFGVMELLARVEALMRRCRPVVVNVERFGDIVVDRAARTVTRNGRPVSLSPKEFDLLTALLAANERVVTRLELMREVWGYVDSVVTRTVDTHVAELRRKLEDDPREPRYILTVKKAGYRLRRNADRVIRTETANATREND